MNCNNCKKSLEENEKTQCKCKNRSMHPFKKIMINGEKIKIDKKLVKLIKELNKLGLKTLGCCQGGIDGPPSIVLSLKDIVIITDGRKKRAIISWNTKKFRKERQKRRSD